MAQYHWLLENTRNKDAGRPPKEKTTTTKNTHKKEIKGGHMIKSLLTEFGRAGRENIWLSVMKHGPRCARSVPVVTSSQIFSRPALPLSQ